MSITKEEIGEIVKATIEGMQMNRLATPEPPTEDQQRQMAFEDISRAISALGSWNPHPVTVQAKQYLKGLLKEL